MSMRSEHEGTEQSSDFSWKVIAGIAAFVLAIIFILQNTSETEISFLFWDFTVGLWFGLLIVLLLGALIGWLAPKFIGRRNRGD